MADGRHFENRYISAANRPNITKFGTQTQILTLSTEMWEKFRNSQIQDGGRTPYWKSFLAITRLRIVRLRRNSEFGGIVARAQRFADENVKFRKSNMADGRHFENRYSSISQPHIVRIWRNLVCRRKFWATRWKRDKNSEILKFKMADGHHIENHFLAITRLHIVRLRPKLERGGIIARTRRLDVENVKFRKIQHGGRPPFWKSLYLHISAATYPNFTKLSMRTQILSQARKCDKKIRNSQIQDGWRTPYWKSFFCL